MVPEGPGAARAIPGESGEKEEDARVAGPLGTADLGWAWLGSARPLLRRTSYLDEGVARSAGAAAPASDLNT